MSAVSQYGWFNHFCLYQSFNTRDDIGDFLPDTGVHRFVFFVWHHELNEIVPWLVGARTRRPQDVFHFLCSDEMQARDLKVLGLSAAHVSHNAFLDESLYSVPDDPDAPREFDAICIARMSRFKRHALASAVPRTLFVGSVVADGDDESYYEELARMMPQAEMTHRKTRWLNTAEVVRHANRAHTGLILSAVEGGSYATTEYVLCGLPVVSTSSVGGRDCWLHPQYSRIVPATSRAVAEAVAELKAAATNPWDIRDHAIKIICEQRQRFFRIGQDIYGTENRGMDFARDFYGSFRHKVAEWRSHRELLALRPREEVTASTLQTTSNVSDTGVELSSADLDERPAEKKFLFDLGFHHGEGFDYLCKRYRIDATWQIFLFEPNSACRARLRTVAASDVLSIAAIPMAAGTAARLAHFQKETGHEGAEDGDGSHLADIGFDLDPKGAGTEVVGTVDFAQFLAATVSPRSERTFTVVKMDVEGAEYGILRKMLSSGTVDLVDVLHVEFHDRLMSSETPETTAALKEELARRTTLVEHW
jgi:FkbM family methyltransferase